MPRRKTVNTSSEAEKAQETAKNSATVVKPVFHMFVTGDNPYNLSEQYKTTAEKIKELNPDIANWIFLKPNTTIRVK